MANVDSSLFRDWNDGDTITAADYERALEILRVAINDNNNGLSDRYTRAEMDILLNSLRATDDSNFGYLQTQIAGIVLGLIPDASITKLKLAFTVLDSAETTALVNASRLDVSKGFAVETRTTDPVAPVVGQMWLRTDL